MTPEELGTIGVEDSLRLWAWLNDHEPQAARSLSRASAPGFLRFGDGEAAMSAAALLRAPGVLSLRQLYPRVTLDSSGDAGASSSDTPGEESDGPAPGEESSS